MRKMLSPVISGALVALSVTMFSGCATDRVTDRDAQPVPKNRLLAFQVPISGGGTAIITRDSGLNGSMCEVGVKIDGDLAGAFGTSEQARFNVTAGTHIFAVTAVGHGICRNLADQSIETVINPSQVRRYRISSNGAGFSINPE